MRRSGYGDGLRDIADQVFFLIDEDNMRGYPRVPIVRVWYGIFPDPASLSYPPVKGRVVSCFRIINYNRSRGDQEEEGLRRRLERYRTGAHGENVKQTHLGIYLK